MRNLLVIPTEKIFYFDEESYFYFNTEFSCLRYGEILQSPKRLFQNDTCKMSFRQRRFFTSTRNLNVIPTKTFFIPTRNLNVIPTEKFFYFDEESVCHSDREVFLLRRGILFLFQHGIFMFSIWRDSSVAEKLLQNDNGLLSFRQRRFLFRRGISMSFRQRRFFTSTRNLFVIPIETFFTSTRNLFVIPTETIFTSPRNLFIFK
jgi:hypothetical protein